MAQTTQTSVGEVTGGPGSPGSNRSGLLLLLLCMAEFMIVLDFSIVNVALPSIQNDLGFTTSGLQWVVSAYALGFGGFLLLGGRICDLYGRKRLFLIGLIVFSVLSLIAGFADNAATLVVLRGLQGLAAAVVGPAAFSLLTTNFPEGKERNRALGVYGAVLSIGFVAGVIAGGVLTQFVGWRWVFFVNVPIGLVTALFTPSLVKEVRATDGPRPTLDIPGAITITGAALSLVYGITSASTNGLGASSTLIALGAAIVLLIAFIAAEQRSSSPLVPLSLFKLRSLVSANIVNLLLVGAFVGVTYVLTLFLQRVEGYSPLKTGLTFAPLGVLAAMAGMYAGKIAAKIGVNAALLIGVLLQGLGALLCAFLPHTNTLLLIVIGTALVGFGDILAVVMISIGATTGVPDHQQGFAGGLLQTTQQIGAALGAAAFAAIAASVTSSLLPAGTALSAATGPDLVSGFRVALLASAITAGVGALIGAALILPAARRAARANA
jgi:EmrB/QacA subfamily drug resistance transporter